MKIILSIYISMKSGCCSKKGSIYSTYCIHRNTWSCSGMRDFTMTSQLM